MTTPTVTSAQIIEVVTAAIEALTPTNAPTANRPETDNPDGFTRHTDNTCKLANVTDPGRLRLIKVYLENPRISNYASAPGATTNWDQDLKVKIGYPMEDVEIIDGTEYDVESELRAMDVEQIKRTIVPAIFTSYPGVKVSRFLSGKSEDDGRTYAMVWGFSFGRST